VGKLAGGFNLAQLQTAQRISRLVDTLTGAHDKMVIEAFEHLVVRLPAKGYGTVEFDMSDARREALIAAGRETMATYLDGRATAVTAATEMSGEEESFFDPEPAPGIDPQQHANRVAGNIFDW
jgi:hypothetical protein